VAEIEQGKVEKQEQESKALARQVSEANLAQVKAMVEMDISLLREKLPGKKEALINHELDMKYLRDRQLILVPSLCGTLTLLSLNSFVAPTIPVHKARLEDR
jgi:hypothetical protein